MGDDAAVLRAPGGTLLFTSDLLIEGIHFELEWTGPRDLGYKSIAVNASDVAAMGGTPRRALVAMGLKPGVQVEWIEEVYAGMRECCDQFDMAVVGGDLSRSDCLVISVALLGNPAGRLVTLRSGARVGDVVGVTGNLGASAAGLRLLRTGVGDRPDLIQAHLRPTARVREAEILRRHLPTSMIDISDGLSADLGHICDASSVGVVVYGSALPLPEVAGSGLEGRMLQFGVTGGEDYELCFTIPPERFEAAAAAVGDATGTPVSRVGEIVEASRGRVLLVEGDEEPLLLPGWDHFRV